MQCKLRFPLIHHMISISTRSMFPALQILTPSLFFPFFCTKLIFLAKRSIVAYSISYIFWKLLSQRLIWHIWGPATCILWPVRFFVTLWESTGSISWNLVLLNTSRWGWSWCPIKTFRLKFGWDFEAVVGLMQWVRPRL